MKLYYILTIFYNHFFKFCNANKNISLQNALLQALLKWVKAELLRNIVVSAKVVLSLAGGAFKMSFSSSHRLRQRGFGSSSSSSNFHRSSNEFSPWLSLRFLRKAFHPPLLLYYLHTFFSHIYRKRKKKNERWCELGREKFGRWNMLLQRLRL